MNVTPQALAFAAMEAALTDPAMPREKKSELCRRLRALVAATPAGLQRIMAHSEANEYEDSELREWIRQARLVYPVRSRPQVDFDRFLVNSGKFSPEILFAALVASIDNSVPEPRVQDSSSAVFTPAQQHARHTINQVADLYFRDAFRSSAIQPRTALLVAGPSGVGKTHLIAQIASERQLPLLRVCYGDWIPQGARHEPSTIDVIREFLGQNERALIQIDELDKLGSVASRGEWTTSVLNDVYSLLDRRLFDGRGQTGSSKILSDRLRHGTFIIGSGTWHDLWPVVDGAKPPMGFGGSRSEQSVPDRIRAARCVPPELLNRFAPSLVLLPPMQREDFAIAIAAQNLESLAREAAVEIDLDDAVSSGLGMRWLEHLILKIHLALAERRGPNESSRLPANLA